MKTIVNSFEYFLKVCINNYFMSDFDSKEVYSWYSNAVVLKLVHLGSRPISYVQAIWMIEVQASLCLPFEDQDGDFFVYTISLFLLQSILQLDLVWHFLFISSSMSHINSGDNL